MPNPTPASRPTTPKTVPLAPLKGLLARWHGFDQSVRWQLINAGLMGFTLDGGINTVIFNLYMLRLGFGPALVGQVNAVGMFIFALVCLPAGHLGERWSLHKIMRAGIMLCLLGTAMIPVTDGLPAAWQAIWLMLANAVANVGLASYYVNAAPYMITLSKPELRTSVFSIQSVFYAAFGFAGSLVGGTLPGWIAYFTGDVLTQPAPYRATLLLVPLAMLVCLRLVWRMRAVTLESVSEPAQSPDTARTPDTENIRPQPTKKTAKVTSALGLIMP